MTDFIKQCQSYADREWDIKHEISREAFVHACRMFEDLVKESERFCEEESYRIHENSGHPVARAIAALLARLEDQP